MFAHGLVAWRHDPTPETLHVFFQTLDSLAVAMCKLAFEQALSNPLREKSNKNIDNIWSVLRNTRGKKADVIPDSCE